MGKFLFLPIFLYICQNKIFEKMKKNKQTDINLEIEVVVTKIFWAILKRRRMYFALRQMLPSKNGSDKIWRKKSGPFIQCHDLNDVANKLTELTVSVGLSDNVSTMDKYDRITADINHLLHFTVEHILSMDEMSKIGQETFDMANFILFGEEIESIEEPVSDEPKAIDVTEKNNDVGIVLGKSPDIVDDMDLPDWGNASHTDDIISIIKKMKQPEF